MNPERTPFLVFAVESGITSIQVGPYHAVLEAGRNRLTILDVDIFAACSKKGFDFDDAWMKDAVTYAKRGDKRGYLPPLHVLHHGDGQGVTAAGVFRVTGLSQSESFGKSTIKADLIVTNPSVIEDIVAGRLPYRSIEILSKDIRRIDSLALLDHEPPYIELPMMGDFMQGGTGEWGTERVEDEAPVLAFSSQGVRVRILMENPMGKPIYKLVEPEEAFQAPAEEEKPYEEALTSDEAAAEDTTVVEPPAEAPTEEAAEDAAPEGVPAEGEAEEAKGTWLDSEESVGNTEMVIEAIRSGSIAIRDFHAIQTAMTEVEAAVHGETPDLNEQPAAEPVAEEPVPEGQPVEGQGRKPDEAAPAEAEVEKKPVPAQAMSRETSEAEAILMARVDALERGNEERDAVKEAMDLLAGRALGEAPEERFRAFARTHGVKAFNAYAEELARNLPAARGDRIDDPSSFDFGKETLPDAVMKFARHGDEALEQASKLYRQHEELKKAGMVRVDLDRYLEIHTSGLNG